MTTINPDTLMSLVNNPSSTEELRKQAVKDIQLIIECAVVRYLDDEKTYSKLLSIFDDAIIDIFYRKYGANQTKAANVLGINRGSFRAKLNALRARL